MDWSASWIWADNGGDTQPFNQTIFARRCFETGAVAAATLHITADSWYRVCINGVWVNDGPCRSWPAHYKYDVIDVTSLLRSGKNCLAVAARYFGVANFHQIPQQPGLLAQLDIVLADGTAARVATDSKWRAVVSTACRADTARVSIQMEQTEWFDSAQSAGDELDAGADDSQWAPAVVVCAAEDGPWRELRPRDVPLLTREAEYPRSLHWASVVQTVEDAVTFHLKQLHYPEDRSANILPLVGVLATVMNAEQTRQMRLSGLPGRAKIRCNGGDVANGCLDLQAGDNLVTLLINAPYSHNLMDLTLGFDKLAGVRFTNPCAADDPNPWAWIGPFYRPAVYSNLPGTNLVIPEQAVREAELIASASSPAGFAESAKSRYAPVPPRTMFLADSYIYFASRRPAGDAARLLRNRAGMLTDNGEWTTIHPAAAGDVELCLDFGRELVGYVEFELETQAPLVVDSFLVEYVRHAEIQHTGDNRNGFRYLAKPGLNRHLSVKRRAGRYLFVTLRQMTAPVRIRMIRLIQSTYPVEYRGSFRCSDAALERIWGISAYTLQLCMEDTFTDCPLYEQTLWVGDARNEALYNTICFGAMDLNLRCLRLTAESMEELPLAGCQVPSGWNRILSAWSFLWCINVWEHYFDSGDIEALRSLYPAVLENLRRSEAFCTDRGLFSLDAWNMFDWAGIDQDHRTVVHNTLFFIGAVRAALECCAALGTADGPWLDQLHSRLRDAVLKLWDGSKGSYPDALLEDGSISESVSQHTSALALLYDVLPHGARSTAVANVLNPPKEMVKVGSPFALQFFLEALEKEGKAAAILQIVREKWEDMLECDATTCWETFRGWESKFPTRSHCHAWSSAPIYVFNRLLLGIVPVAPGAAEVVVSPHPLGLKWAEGASWSPCGELRVAWRLDDGTLSIQVCFPESVQWSVRPNADWRSLRRVLVNGVEIPLTERI